MSEFTAQGAAHDDEIVKVRMQATPDGINRYRDMLEKCEELGMCQMLNFSNLFSNKGTTKFYRAYSDIKVKKEESHE